MVEKVTTIKVSKNNRDRLAKFGDVGDSFDDALGRVLAIAEAEKEKQKQDPLIALDDSAFAVPAHA
jgi:hypothetical protein